MNFFSQKIFSFIAVVFLSIVFYLGIESVGTFSMGDYAVGQIEHQRDTDNKTLLSVSVDGEVFLVPLYIKDIEKQYFQFEKGEKIIFKTYYTADRKPEYKYIGKYIFPYVVSSIVFFLGFLFLLFSSAIVRPLISLLASILFIVYVLFPSLLAGQNMYLVGFLGVTVLLIFSILFTNGFSRAAYMASVCCAIILAFAYFLGEGIGMFFDLFGYAGSNISYLETEYQDINVQGIFFIGVYLGIVGVIDDVTMAQSTAAEEIAKANPQYSFLQLYKAGMVLGQAHIFSMLNTLIFAYIGTSIPAYFYILSLDYPFFAIVNSTLFAEEFFRVLVALLALSFAIPLTALVSSWWITKQKDIS